MTSGNQRRDSMAQAADAISGGPAEALRRFLLQHGFDRAGFARAGPAAHAERLQEWLEAGHAGGMAYLARNAARRADPRRVVPGARTVIAVALHYRGKEARGAGPPEGGRAFISCYAQGQDYHRVLERRLLASCQALARAHPGHLFRYYADTGPVLERSWAEAAGIGWIGKNTCALDPERGSYFFIGTIITTLEIAPDPPSSNHCGACRLCIDACPTGALLEPYRLDSRRCISYLTIELRGPIPEALRPALGNMVFGCDLCQEACPFNRPDRLSGDGELAPREENLFPALESLAALDCEEKFRARFPRSAVRRARWSGFLRNLAVAMGNSGRKALIPLLERLAQGPAAAHQTVREAVAWAKARLNSG
ncbi:MAG: tRNA epoxyqueuosine(34) reductase QueG [Planctomycetes bacterium]|nr:tRNA epoxyqueuosine(34) reductase QueG [Planctomycetota bacterium]